jgi:hypothetical protein
MVLAASPTTDNRERDRTPGAYKLSPRYYGVDCISREE